METASPEKVFQVSLGRFFWWFALPGSLLGGYCLYLLWWLWQVWPAALEGRLGMALPLIVLVGLIFGSLGSMAWAHAGLEYELQAHGLLVKQRGARLRFSWDRLICTRSHRTSWRARLHLSDGEKEHLVESFFLPDFEALATLAQQRARRRSTTLTP
ncbi:hypothetical protein DYH09_02760 [bacterium CPR1]|nr:hypothetical protein [bacterium CPR1]